MSIVDRLDIQIRELERWHNVRENVLKRRQRIGGKKLEMQTLPATIELLKEAKSLIENNNVITLQA